MSSSKSPNIFVKLLMLLWYAVSHPLIWIGKKLYGVFSHINYRKTASGIVHFVGNFLHWLIFKVLLPKKYRNITKKEIYRIIFKADTPAGKRFDVWLLIFIGINLLVIILDSFEAVHTNLRWVLKGLEWFFTIAFTLEYYLRIYCLQRPWKYVFSFYGIIDFLSIFPAYLSLLIPATQTLTVLRVLRTLRIFRIFNMQRFLRESFHLINAMRRSITKILIFMLFVFIIAIITAIYWAVVTITTVGYGDITPVTPMGQFISTLVMLLGYSIIAVPTGIVVGETVREYRNGDGDVDIPIPEDFSDYDDKHNSDAHMPDSPDADMQELRVCPRCGHSETDEAARFCRYCGTLLQKSQPRGWISDFFHGE